MQWTDRIRQVKIMLVVAAILIAVASLFVSRMLTHDLVQEERKKVEVWAAAMRSLNLADENTDLELVLKVINNNTTIPVVVMGTDDKAQFYRNIQCPRGTGEDSLRYATDYVNVCYDESLLLRRLEVYPVVQLGVVMIFVVVAIFALLTSKRAEQNKVWVGLSKETAHQLGTPISSLMAWTEMLRESYPDDTLIPEMDKDVKRLQLIADRFSKIGSLPEPVPTSLNDVLTHVIDYMDRRTSKSVRMIKDMPAHDVIVRLNGSLFEWVIENLSKNAVDAMQGEPGTITLHVEDTPQLAIVEVSDTGKGIRKKDLSNVFRPGFTTKKRGWGLGLSLAKRIVEEYHHGRIYVKRSEVGKGTTFRIELKK